MEVAAQAPPLIIEENNLVTWSGPDDLDNPQNFSFARKTLITTIWVYGNLTTAIGSSIWSSGSNAIASEFSVSSVVVTLGISLFLLVGCAFSLAWYSG